VGVTFDTRAQELAAEWDASVERAYTLGHGPLPAQSEVIGVVNRVSGPRDVVVCAAGSMPGDLHKLWRARDPNGYHVEYGYSTMGYEIAGGLGVKMAAPDREVFVLVGDGSYLMMAQEIVTAVAEGIKLTIVLVQNHGYQSLCALSESVGSQRFGTRYRYRNVQTGALDGGRLPVDLAANAASLGARARAVTTIAEFEAALREAAASEVTSLVQVQTDPLVSAPDSEAWWEVPVAAVAALDSTRSARAGYEASKATQKTYLKTPETVRTA
jgi:3D-(3,5/4)-trihydroxycyclohexane-1,2-dione acylhydrolase (decyclizing)